MAARDEADRAKLHQICDLSYKAQAIWFLNGFWAELSGEKEKLWAYVEKASSIDIDRRETGSALDEVNAHRLLEIFDETLTVREMRTQLRSVGALTEAERPKTVPLAHLLLARYKVDWHKFVNAPQGDSAELERAQAKLDACKAAFEEAQRRLAESKAAAAELAAKEAELRQAQAELDAALAEVKAQEDAYAAKTADLTRRSEEGGVVSRNKAKNELAQHLAEDPLPLRKAKITLEAATKRNERALTAAAEARAAAEAAAHAAAEAVAVAQQRLDEAEAYLREVSATAGGGKGALWWIERELHEQRKYLPTSRGGISK